MCDIALMKLHTRCKTPSEPISIYVKLRRKGLIGICSNCWSKIGNRDWEIGPTTHEQVEAMLHRRVEEETNAIPTEYRMKSTVMESSTKEEDDYGF
jgi:hypothetical protein